MNYIIFRANKSSNEQFYRLNKSWLWIKNLNLHYFHNICQISQKNLSGRGTNPSSSIMNESMIVGQFDEHKLILSKITTAAISRFLSHKLQQHTFTTTLVQKWVCKT